MPRPSKREIAMVVVTLARLLLVWGLVASIGSQHWMTALWVVVIVVVDLFDGIVARALSADGVSRRIADVVIDYITIVLVFAAVRRAMPQYTIWPLALMFATIAVVKLPYFAAGVISFFKYHVLLRGKGWHRAYPVSLAVVGLMMVFDVDARGVMNVLGGAVAVYGIHSSLDFWYLYRNVVRVHYGDNKELVVLETTAGWPTKQKE